MEETDTSSKEQLIRWEKTARDTIDVKRCYVDIAGDLIAGILLSQIIYWFLPTKNGLSKIRLKKNGIECLAKHRSDWWNECRITPKQYDRAMTCLVKKGLVTVTNSMFDAKRTPFISVNWDVVTTELDNQYRANGSSHIVDIGIDQR